MTGYNNANDLALWRKWQECERTRGRERTEAQSRKAVRIARREGWDQLIEKQYDALVKNA